MQLLSRSWYAQKKRKSTPDQGQQRGNGSTTPEPFWKSDLENDVKGLRKQISIATSELERIKRNGKTTKKGQKNWKYFQEKGVKISSESLTNFIEGKKAEIRITAKRRQRKIQQDRSWKWNRQFQRTAKRHLFAVQKNAFAPIQKRKDRNSLTYRTRVKPLKDRKNRVLSP